MTVLVPELRPALSRQKMYAYADKHKIELPHVEWASAQMVFNWIANRTSGMNQAELYQAIADFEVKQ